MMIAKSSESFPEEKMVVRIINEGIELCNPYNALKERIKAVNKKYIKIGRNKVNIGSGKLYVIGWGKAAGSMAAGIERILGNIIHEGIVVSSKNSYKTKKIKVLEGSHPYPSIKSVRASKKIIGLVKRCKESDTVICLVSGGGSALFCCPVPEIGLKLLRKVIKLLILNKVEDGNRNVVWKHLDLVKGGRLANMVYPASMYNLFVSDYKDNVLDVIASGPTVPDSYTFRDALNVIQKHGLASKMPDPVINYLKSNLNRLESETIKSNSKIFKRTKNIILLDNRKALLNFAGLARKNGFRIVHVQKNMFYENAEKCAEELSKGIQKMMRKNKDSDFIMLAGGEIPVKVRKKGLGGRAQHFAALMIPHIKNYSSSVFAAFSSDGRDYIEGISGAIITGNTMKEAVKRNLNIKKFINQTNTYALHKELGTHLATKAPTGTHVSDIYIFAHFGRNSAKVK